MIVGMEKVFLAVRAAEKDRLLDSLRRLGVVHLRAVDPGKATPEERTVSAAQRLRRAEQVLASVAPFGEAPDLEPLAAGDRVLEIFSKAAEGRNRLSSLHREAKQLAPWGDVRLSTLQSLHDTGLVVRFFTAAAQDVAQIPGECVEVVGTVGKRQLVAAVYRGDEEPELPESVEQLELPSRDRPTVLAEAKAIDQQMEAGAEELSRLANCTEAILTERQRLEEQARYSVADRGGLTGEALFAVQGWVPAESAPQMLASLKADGIDAGVDFVEPAEDEEPPTLVRYPRWARPMQGLFQILGTTPGYREFDVSGTFMIALPIFAAMLIADGGYGLLFLVPTLLLYKKMCRAAGKPLTQLIMIIGAVSLIWGLITCTFFGVGGYQMKGAGGIWAGLYAMLSKVQLIGSPLGTAAETLTSVRLAVTRIAFIMGAIHMSFAQLWRALGYWPNLKALSHVGWAIFLWGMLLVVNHLVLSDPVNPVLLGSLLGVGGAMAIVFASPNRNPAKMLGYGLASFPLSALGTLSDTISYIRLMAVGLASGILAATFNTLGTMLAESATWFAGGAVILVGHALNVGLAIIALFAHGVRLNMLEFSNNLGMAWSGYKYEPFSAKQVQET